MFLKRTLTSIDKSTLLSHKQPLKETNKKFLNAHKMVRGFSHQSLLHFQRAYNAANVP